MSISIGKAVMLAAVSAVVSSLVTVAVMKSGAPPAPAKEPAAVVAEQKPAAVPAPAAPVPEPPPGIDIEEAMKDRAFGSDDAPVTIIEYASMTCDHCAAFHAKVLPDVKKELVDTGKARLIYRDMPWDKFALKAAKLARCAPPEKYFELVETIFSSHDDWVHRGDPAVGLKNIGVGAGMDENYAQSCLDDEKLEAAILEKQQQARKEFNISSTPFFVFMKDGERLENFPEFEEIAKKLGEHKH